jgi:choice-of-anchor B domain-containing protein
MLADNRPLFRRLTFPFLLFMFLVALVGVQTHLAAQEQPPATVETGSGELTTVQQKFLEDVLPPENLSPMTATQCVFGMAGIYPCNNVDLMAFMPLATIGGGNGNDSWGWTDPTNGNEYALMGRTSGTAFVDITDPENPIYLGNLPTQTVNSSWRDIKVYADHAFIVSEATGHGMQVFDLTRLRNVVSPPVTFTTDAHYPGVGRVHNLVINEDSGFAYAVGSSGSGTTNCSGGLHMINIQNPLTPTFAGCFSSDGYTHDAQCVLYFGPDAAHRGKEICFNSNEDTVTIVDVTNKSAPVQLARQGYTGSRSTPQAWLTEDQRYLLVDDELDEQNNGHNTRTYIWDVTNLDGPVLINSYTAAVASIDHNLYTVGNYAFAANYRSGLRILNTTNVSSGTLTEAAFFDIYPTNDNASFNGAWSNYPYFDSGNIIISGIEQGLFVVRPTNLPPDFRLHAATNEVNFCGNGSQNVSLALASVYSYTGGITLTTTTLPTGLTATFSNPVSVPGTTQMTLNASGLASGSYVFGVYGYDATVSHYDTIKVKASSAPVAPTLTTPANGATGQVLQPSFTWGAVADATSYDLDVATDAGFSNIVLSADGLTATNYTPTAALNTGTTYYWRIQTNGTCGSSPYSATFSFTTQVAVPSAPTLLTPTNGATNQSLQPTLTWNVVSGATSYSLQVATDAGFSNVVIAVSGLAAANYTPTTSLANNTTYYWRVLASNGSGDGAYSTAFSFTTEAMAMYYLYLPFVSKP